MLKNIYTYIHMEKSYFISGSSKMTANDFVSIYGDWINNALHNERSRFVVGGNTNFDRLCQLYLRKIIKPEELYRVSVFYRGEVPRVMISDEFLCYGGFTSNEEVNSAMTLCSDEDIVFFSIADSKYSDMVSNLIRRHRYDYDYHKYLIDGNENFWKNILY